MGNVVLDFSTRTAWPESPVAGVHVDWPEAADDYARGHALLAIQRGIADHGLRLAIARIAPAPEQAAMVRQRALEIRRFLNSCQAGLDAEFVWVAPES